MRSFLPRFDHRTWNTVNSSLLLWLYEILSVALLNVLCCGLYDYGAILDCRFHAEYQEICLLCCIFLLLLFFFLSLLRFRKCSMVIVGQVFFSVRPCEFREIGFHRPR